jgi:hypothetical protein
MKDFRHKPLRSILFVFLTAFVLQGCVQLDLPITQGIVKDDFTISLNLNNRRMNICPDRFFTLDSLGLRANTTPLMTNDPNLLNCYKDGKKADGKFLTNVYPVSIQKDNKTFYGQMAFFNASKSASSQGVTSYYQISVSDKYFEEALQGRTSCTYEYWRNGANSYITWIIWLSDAPLKSNIINAR